MFCTRTATSTSADSSVFVVTILNGLPRPHGISHTSFIVYLPNLRIKVTVAFWNFTALGQLVRLIRLSIRFLFVRPRFRYCFFSPKGHPLKLASRYGVRWQLRPAWTFTTGDCCIKANRYVAFGIRLRSHTEVCSLQTSPSAPCASSFLQSLDNLASKIVRPHQATVLP